MAAPVNGLVAHWSMATVSGNIILPDTGSVNAVLRNGAVLVDTDDGKAVRTNGRGAHIGFGAGFAPLLVSGNFTLSFRVFLRHYRSRDYHNDQAMLLQQWYSAGSSGNLFILYGEIIYTWNNKTLNYTLPLNQWVRLTISASGGTATLYLDGQPQGSLPMSGGGSSQEMRMGNLWNNRYNADADFRDFYIYNRALTAKEVAEFDQVAGVFSGSLMDMALRTRASAPYQGSLLDMALRRLDPNALLPTHPLLDMAFQRAQAFAGGVLDVAMRQRVEARHAGGLLDMALRQRGAFSGSLIDVGLRRVRLAGRRRFRGSQTLGLDGLDYDIEVRIAGAAVPMCELAESMTIRHAENQSYLCDFVLRQARGLIDPYQWHGKDIEVDIVTDSRRVRLYSGVVDIGRIEFPRRAVVLQCSDRRKQRNNALPRTVIEAIGYTSVSAHGEAFKDQDEELRARLETVPASFEYDAHGTGYLTPWQPKATADFVMGPCMVYVRDPAVTLASVGRVVNQVKIRFEHRYSRQQQRDLRYEFLSDCNVCNYGIWGLPPKTEMVASAAKGAGWAVGGMRTVGLEPGGWYSCGTVKGFVWVPKVTRTTGTRPRTDMSGNTVRDHNGNEVMDVTSVSVADYTMMYAREAEWKASKRWVQNITEALDITLTNAASIARYELLEENLSYAVVHEYRDESWGKDYQTPSVPAGFARLANGDYYRDMDNVAAGEYDKTLQVALHTAYTKILSSHRDNTLDLQVKMMPDIDLRHTHRIEHPHFKGNAKVYGFVHSFDMAAGIGKTDVIYKFYQSADGSGIRPLTLPVRKRYGGTPGGGRLIRLGSVLLPDGAADHADRYQGQIMRPKPGRIGDYRETVMFKVVTPAVEAGSTDTAVVENSHTQDVGIPNDNVEIRL